VDNNYNFVRIPNKFCVVSNIGALEMKTINTMKRILTLLFIAITISLSGQEGPKISTAVIALERNQDIVDAKKYIDEATEIINTKDKSAVKFKDLRKYYYYNGIIHFRIANSEDPEIIALEPNALDIAAENLAAVVEYEANIGKEAYTDRAKEQLPYVASAYAQRGIDKAGREEFNGAYEDFMRSYEMKRDLNISVDTSMYYNAALMAQNAKEYEKAIPIYEDLIEMQYRGLVFKATDPESGKIVEFPNKITMDRAVAGQKVTDPRVEGDLRPDLYVNAANLYLMSGDTAKYDAMVADGRQKYPENEALLRAELQKFLETEQYDKALINLDQAIAKDPDNKLFYYIKGYILQTSMKDMEGARAAYALSISKDPEYLEPQYMTGLSYIDYANKLSEEMNALPLNATTKYKELKEKQEQAFKDALPFFEKAREISPDDMDTLNALKEVYYKLKMVEKAQDVQAKLDELGGGS
jgi:tetratricopeptide (TPR) repeat protein